MSIETINDLAMCLVADDFSYGHRSSQPGPTKTSRAMAIIHLAAHDAYAKVTGSFPPRLSGLPPAPVSGGSDADGTTALLGAGFHAAELLYPDFVGTVNLVRVAATTGLDPILLQYGVDVADTWYVARKADGSEKPTEDLNYAFPAPGVHRPDPFNLSQTRHGSQWGAVKPFVIGSVIADAALGPAPNLNSSLYAKAYDEVFECGTVHLPEGDKKARHKAAVGLFWGYDGANRLGTPPRLYNQVVREIPAVKNKTLSHPKRIRLLTAINAAMADAGIAAWHWKYVYDVWRPILGIREADAGWGPTGGGDGNTHRKRPGNPFWRPLGAPRSNPFPGPIAGAPGDNFTPNFPAYPSGHATFGSACFETAAKLLNKKPEAVTVKFASDEFNGTTTDNHGVARTRWEQKITLRQAIDQNSGSRIYLGVHWKFDAEGGETVGEQIAKIAAAAFA